MSEVRRLEREMTDLQGRLDEISTKMDKSTKELQREQVKNKNVSKHTQVICLFGLMLYVPVNSYGHIGTVSSPNHTGTPR